MQIHFKIYFTFFICLLIQTTKGLAQTSTDLWVMDVEGKGGKIKLLPATAKPLTNRPEYDNQPSFINDSELIFSAADAKGNNDLILYSFRTQKFTNLTQSPDRSEFSPSLTECGSYFSAIVVEPDGTQRLWLYPITGEAPELLYDDIFPVAKGNEVFTKHIQERDWHSLGKIESSSHQGITRLAYSPELNKIILVLNRK